MKFQLKIPIFSQSDGDATWWPNSSKQNLTWGQLRYAHRYQKYLRLVRTFLLKSFLHVHANSEGIPPKIVNTVKP